MTNNQFLDSILSVYNADNTDIFKGKKLYFSFICQKLEDDVEDWRIEFLKKQLLSDGLLEYGYGDGEPMKITDKGIRHSQNGGYSKIAETTNRKELIDIETIEKFKRDRVSFRLSLIAFFFSFLALLASLITLIHKW